MDRVHRRTEVLAVPHIESLFPSTHFQKLLADQNNRKSQKTSEDNGVQLRDEQNFKDIRPKLWLQSGPSTDTFSSVHNFYKNEISSSLYRQRMYQTLPTHNGQKRPSYSHCDAPSNSAYDTYTIDTYSAPGNCDKNRDRCLQSWSSAVYVPVDKPRAVPVSMSRTVNGMASILSNTEDLPVRYAKQLASSSGTLPRPSPPNPSPAATRVRRIPYAAGRSDAVQASSELEAQGRLCRGTLASQGPTQTHMLPSQNPLVHDPVLSVLHPNGLPFTPRALPLQLASEAASVVTTKVAESSASELQREESRKEKVAKFLEKKLCTRASKDLRRVRYPARSLLAGQRSRTGGRFAKESSARVITTTQLLDNADDITPCNPPLYAGSERTL